MSKRSEEITLCSYNTKQETIIGEKKDLPQNKTERDGFFTSEVTNGGSLRRNNASMSCPSVFTLIRSHKRFLFLSPWHLIVSYLLKSSAGKLNCQPSRWQFFPKISVLFVVVYAVSFFIVNCSRRWHKFDVIGENWWALTSLFVVRSDHRLGLRSLVVVRLRVLISCSGSERQRTCIWVCRPLPVVNPPLRCPSVLWEGSAGELAGSEKT